jgi:hypothetical protein
MPRNLKRHYENGDLRFITISCDQKKEEKKAQRPKSDPARNGREERHLWKPRLLLFT